MAGRRSTYRNYWKLYDASVVQLIALNIISGAGLLLMRTKRKMRWGYTHFRPRVESFFIATGQYGRYGIFLTLSWFDRDQEGQAHWLT